MRLLNDITIFWELLTTPQRMSSSPPVPIVNLSICTESSRDDTTNDGRRGRFECWRHS